jgi:hypothetical protein
VRSQYINTGRCGFVTSGTGKLEVAPSALTMPETCTCGAQLPPDSLFCHKCGKPQREILAPEGLAPMLSAPATGAATAFAPAPAGGEAAPAFAAPRFAMPVSFRNPVALRISLFVGVAAMFFSFLPILNWLAAGFFAVFFYRRKTHNLLNVGAGLQLGWITGLVMSTVWGVIFMAEGLSGKLTGVFQEQIKNLPSANDPSLQQVAQFMATGPGLLIVLAIYFVFITSVSMAGGALGAVVRSRARR